MNPSNFSLAWQEHQDAAALLIDRIQAGLHNAGLDKLAWLERPSPQVRHRIHATFTGDHGCIVEQPRQAFSLKRRRHHQHLQWLLITEQLTATERQSQGEIGIKVSRVELVKDDQANALERGIVLESASQNTFGDHFDARSWAHPAFEANSVADRLANFLAQLAGQPLRSGARCQSARFEHQDGLSCQPRFPKHGQGDTRGLARTRGGLQDGFISLGQCLK
ncbi:hypothetical protein D3C80_776960 [compost metagenome]